MDADLTTVCENLSPLGSSWLNAGFDDPRDGILGGSGCCHAACLLRRAAKLDSRAVTGDLGDRDKLSFDPNGPASLDTASSIDTPLTSSTSSLFKQSRSVRTSTRTVLRSSTSAETEHERHSQKRATSSNRGSYQTDSRYRMRREPLAPPSVSERVLREEHWSWHDSPEALSTRPESRSMAYPRVQRGWGVALELDRVRGQRRRQASSPSALIHTTTSSGSRRLCQMLDSDNKPTLTCNQERDAQLRCVRYMIEGFVVRKLARVVVLIAIFLGLFIAPTPANASGTGTWSAKPSSWTLPSNHHCGSSHTGTGTAMQSCVVRSGNYVQAALVLRNLSSSSRPVGETWVVLWDGRDAMAYDVSCPSSSMAPNGVSVCYGPTLLRSQNVYANGQASPMPPFPLVIAASGWA